MQTALSQTIRPELKLTGLQILTQRFLTLPLPQLQEELEGELSQNPDLERLDPETSDTDDIGSEPTTSVTRSSSVTASEDKWPGEPETGFEEFEAPAPERSRFGLENLGSAGTSLAEHLLSQLRISAPEALRTAGEAIIWSLDDHGYLRATVTEIAVLGDVSVATAEQALVLVQSFDPTGVAARDLRECLLLQLRTDPKADPVAVEIVDHHFDELARNRQDHLGRLLDLPMSRIRAALDAIRRLDPRPGRAFGTLTARVVRPDAAVEKIAGEYVVTLSDDGLPVLAVTRAYRHIWRRLSPGERRFVSERRQAARWIIEAIEQRRRTLQSVIETVVRLQRRFFDHGVAYIRPLVLRQVAEEIAVHESTVSRATSGKYLDTPHGVFPLKYFFQPGIHSEQDGPVATVAVKDALRAIIGTEDTAHPLSDLALASALRARGLPIARRTVAKYRDELGIPPCHRRRTGPREHRRTDSQNDQIGAHLTAVR